MNSPISKSLSILYIALICILMYGVAWAQELPDALDIDLPFVTGGDAAWFGQEFVSFDDQDAARAGDIIDWGEVSWLETEVDGPALLFFKWSVSSRNLDRLLFFINGTEAERISGEVDWAQRMYELPEGRNTLQWRYEKKSSKISGSNTGWVDQVIVHPLSYSPSPEEDTALQNISVHTGQHYESWGYGRTTVAGGGSYFNVGQGGTATLGSVGTIGLQPGVVVNQGGNLTATVIPFDAFIMLNSPLLAPDQVLQAQVFGLLSDGSTKEMTSSVTSWSSSNAEIATVNQAGVITGQHGATFGNSTSDISAALFDKVYSTTLKIQYPGTCNDHIANQNEDGVDCGGVCPATCVDCDAHNYGNATSSWVFSFNDQVVIDAAHEALDEYANHVGVPVADLDTASERMEAVAWYVAAYMEYMYDEGGWNGAQTAARIIRDSGDRTGCLHKDSEDDECDRRGKCSDQDSPIVPNEHIRFCGDCEDHAIVRASLLRHLGVSHECVVLADYHEGWDHPQYDTDFPPWELPQDQLFVDPEGPGTPPEPYPGYSNSSRFRILAKETTDTDGKKGGHTFNVVLYYNKYRIMDYHPLGYYFTSDEYWESQEIDNIWTDHYGQHWDTPATAPSTYIHNYPGANKCYEGERNRWTLDTLYEDVCP